MTIKELMQKRDAIVTEMNGIVALADKETRDLKDDEVTKFEELEKSLKNLDATIEAKRALEDVENTEVIENEPETRAEEPDVEELETRAFEDYLRNRVEKRDADTNMTYGDNGAVVPSSVANKIIAKVYDICPIFNDADRYNVKGNLTIPYYDESTQQIVAGYADEFTDGNSTSGKFTAITLTGFLGRAITDVSKSLINNSNFDIVSYVIDRMAIAIAKFIEKELLIGTPADESTSPATPAKILGLSGVTQTVTSAANTALTADEIIDLQETVPDVYQENAYFIMNRKTRAALRKLKASGSGEYILNRDANSRWGYTLFGKDVYTSDNMPEVKAANAGKVAVYYGDMSGLAVKVSQDVEIEVFREVKGRQHAVEVVGFVELDAKVQDAQKIAALVLHA